MPSFDVPFLGTLIISATLVAAAYTFAIGVAAGRGRPQMLGATRYGAYTTAALIALGICLLAYAFQTHDFRIRYVARYSDRSMEWWYLVTSLWGGQDGSLLWWSFLLAGWTAACVRWMKGRFTELQPWVIATLMSIIAFFQILMLFAANPFAMTPASTPLDGEGLNPLLQNYWMIIHPPTLYMGFVGWAVPFSFAIAALATGRLHDEWLLAIRKWTLMVWLFLSCGLLLGALWSYEELGWGGYWAWDPVENASFMPWLVGTAFLHSVIIQERYGMLKGWNIFLICLTFFMTIFGTFLTRSGLIASVHAFAESDIGVYFVWYLVIIAVFCAVMIIWRWKDLQAVHKIESLMSREFAFLLNNWILIAMMVTTLVLTTFPLISDWLWDQEVSVGPPIYNRWMIPFGIVLLTLAGVGPLISWRKATGKNLRRAFRIPVAAALGAGLLHAVFGSSVGFAGYIPAEAIYDGPADKILAALFSVAPVISTITCSFVVATVVQEFWRGTAVRMRSKGEGAVVALITLVGRAKRRYGGYIVHVAVVLMYIGFTGAAYDVEKEAALRPGEALEIGGYQIRYDDVRMESDLKKRMIFTDMTVVDGDGDEIALISPAKFIYRTHPEMPTTEVAIRYGAIEDIYVIMASVDPTTKLGTFRVIVRPLVMWIWIGSLLMIFGTFVSVSPSVKELLALGAAQADDGGTRAQRQRRLLLRVGGALVVATVVGLVATYGATQSMGLIFILFGAVVTLGVLVAAWQSLRGAFGADEGLAFAAAGVSAQRQALEAEKNALVGSLRDLEFERDLGKISDADFGTLEKRLRSRAKGVLKLLDADVAPFIAHAEDLVAKHLAGLGKGSPYRDRMKRDGRDAADSDAPAPKQAAVSEAPAASQISVGSDGSDAEQSAVPATAGIACWSCETENDGDADWCKKCGARVSERQCGECETWNDPDAAFCKKCAHRFDGAAPAGPASAAPAAEGEEESASEAEQEPEPESDSDSEEDDQ